MAKTINELRDYIAEQIRFNTTGAITPSVHRDVINQILDRVKVIETSAEAGGKITIYTETSDPTATDDTDSGYEVGDIWINTGSDAIFVAADVSAGAAVWNPIQQTALYIKTSDPSATDDTDSGYEKGDHWINTSSNKAFLAVDVSSSAAVWARADNIKSRATTGDPSTSDDAGKGYEIGSWWVNTSTGQVFVAVDVSSNAAQWVRTDNKKFTTATSDPGASDDTDSGYEVGSYWINTSSNEIFVAVDVTATAAVWKNLVALNSDGTLQIPTMSSDPSSPPVGSIWYRTDLD